MQNPPQSTNVGSDRRLCSSEATQRAHRADSKKASGDHDGGASRDWARHLLSVEASPLLVVLVCSRG